MPLNQWTRAKEIFFEAAELPFDERSAFVNRACNGSHDLQAFVERLLAQSRSDESVGIFSAPEHRGPQPHPDATIVGRSLLHYQILAKLGEGGMGAVYRAADTHLMRDVAIKVLSATHASDPAVRVRFIIEARATSALSHPNIITVHDISSHDGLDFIVMEYLQGKTLAEMLPAQKGLPPADVLKYAVQIAAALAEAHAAKAFTAKAMTSGTRAQIATLAKIES